MTDGQKYCLGGNLSSSEGEGDLGAHGMKACPNDIERVGRW